jgi:hypothetical protein
MAHVLMNEPDGTTHTFGCKADDIAFILNHEVMVKPLIKMEENFRAVLYLLIVKDGRKIPSSLFKVSVKVF